MIFLIGFGGGQHSICYPIIILLLAGQETRRDIEIYYSNVITNNIFEKVHVKSTPAVHYRTINSIKRIFIIIYIFLILYEFHRL